MDVNVKYKTWIAKNYPNAEKARNKCAIATTLMQREFPELKRVRGHIILAIRGKLEHWWLEDVKESVIDPTKKQFISDLIMGYEKYSGPDPFGICYKCGEYIWNENTRPFCEEHKHLDLNTLL